MQSNSSKLECFLSPCEQKDSERIVSGFGSHPIASVLLLVQPLLRPDSWLGKAGHGQQTWWPVAPFLSALYVYKEGVAGRLVIQSPLLLWEGCLAHERETNGYSNLQLPLRWWVEYWRKTQQEFSSEREQWQLRSGSGKEQTEGKVDILGCVAEWFGSASDREQRSWLLGLTLARGRPCAI